MFFQILDIISRKLPALKLGDKILPGILVLRGFSSDSFGCKWAKDILRKTTRFNIDDYDNSWFVEFFKVLRKEKTDFPFDFMEVLEMLGELSEKMDQQGMLIKRGNGMKNIISSYCMYY